MAKDAFFDIYQLYRNNKLIDKTEVYIYFYELSLGNEKFPLFYIPITIDKKEDKFIFQFEKRVFVNTKAIDFVVQEFNLQTNNQSTLAGEFDRILYINGEDNFYSILENYIRKIENFFELNKNDLADKMLKIISDQNKLENMGKQSRLLIEKHSQKYVIEKFEKLYQKIIKAKC